MAQNPPIQSNPSFELVDQWDTPSLGKIDIYMKKPQNQLIVHKKLFLRNNFKAGPDETQLLELRIKELPEEVTLASGNYSKYDPQEPLFNPGSESNDLFIDYSTSHLKGRVAQLKKTGQTVSNIEALSHFGFLVGLGSFMEQGLEFHRSVCLKNLLFVDGKVQLVNPYISDNHIRLVLDEFIKPILALGDSWTPMMFVDDQVRRDAGAVNPSIKQINERHRNYIRRMHVDCCLVFLALASTEDDSVFLDSLGGKNQALIRNSIQNLHGRFPEELVSIVSDVLLASPESVPTFIEVNDSMSEELREQLVNSINNFKHDIPENVGYNGHQQPREITMKQTDLGDYKPNELQG